jgi:hypothetical protein
MHKGKILENTILTTTMNLRWNEIEPFFVSLKRFSPKSKCVCFYSSTDDYTIKKLKSYSDVSVEFTMTTKPRSVFNRIRKISKFNFCRIFPELLRERLALHFLPLGSLRFFLYRDYLTREKITGNILHADIRDVIFQCDPFENITLKNTVQFFMEDTNNCRIRNFENVNYRWLRNVFGSADANGFINKVTSCAGTIMGDLIGMKSYLNLLCRLLAKSREFPEFGSDQAVHNYICYNCSTRFVKQNITNAHGSVLTVACSSPGTYKLTSSGEVLDSSGRLIPVLHTYDREPRLVAALLERLNRG